MAARCPAGPEPITMKSYLARTLFSRELLRAVEPVLDFLPVDGVPPRGQIIGPAVLILQVVGVLPYVDPQHRKLAFHDRAVLVRRRDDVHLADAFDEPRPAGAEASG